MKIGRQNYYFQREMALMPATQALTQTTIMCENLMSEVKKQEIVVKQATTLLVNLRQDQSSYQQRLNFQTNGRHAVARGATFVCACPASTCKGFIDQNYTCGLCSLLLCRHCRFVCTDDHMCDANDIASVNALKNDTRPCPKCAAPIFKIDGCSQMWCLNCKVFFNWQTMTVSQGIPHNPDYYRYLREHPASVNRDAPCGPGLHMPPAQDVATAIRAIVSHQHEWRLDYGGLMTTHQRISHFINYTAVPTGNDVAHRNQTYRVKLLRQQIDNKTFKVLVQRSEKTASKVNAITQVAETTELMAGDIFRQVLRATSTAHLEDCVRMLQTLIEPMNTCLLGISRQFNCMVPLLQQDWKVAKTKYKRTQVRNAE